MIIWAKVLTVFRGLSAFKIYFIIAGLALAVGFFGGYKTKKVFYEIAHKETVDKAFKEERKLIEKDVETETIVIERIKEVLVHAEKTDIIECFSDGDRRLFNNE